MRRMSERIKNRLTARRIPQTNRLSKAGGGEEPVKIKTVGPAYRGALIVCDGADSAVVRLQVTQCVSALTGLSSNQISVIKMKN